MKQTSDYIKALRTVRDEGHWIENQRTGVKCLTKINLDLTYHVDRGELPLDTTRKSFWKPAIAELLGYIRGYTDAKQFADLGAKTWFANANENKAWLENRFRVGENDMGIVYGAVGNNWPKLGIPNGGDSLMLSGHLDLLENIVNDLKNGIDDRGEIWSFWNPGMFQLGCLRPCMYSHHFSLVDDTLYLNSTQRSWDGPLGGNANAVQCYVLLALMAQITGHKPGKVYHKVVNAHIYENQYQIMLDSGHLDRDEFPFPKLKINPEIKTLEDLRTWVTLSDFHVEDYQHHDAIKYPFTV